MSEIMQKLDENYNRLKAQHNVTDTRYYIGEINDSKPEDFAKEAIVVLEAYMEGRYNEVKFND